MADLRQVVFSQTGHFHDGIAVNAVLSMVRAILSLPVIDHSIEPLNRLLSSTTPQTSLMLYVIYMENRVLLLYALYIVIRQRGKS
ncbi:hypothetical protein ACM17_24620 [Escherichia coli]|nr:hypothetical protein VK74_25325 [Escherichia coli]APK96795.1 hypothetical protein RG54_24640 [Escherichia coli]APL01654.1 hypothetical protein RG55_24620 [Escherichia coli]APL35715.1 hypothetical protein RG62_24450 [Escherichia coli]KMV37424.1 hypothetical protein ACM17_24620 [Escherichia coli]